MNLKEHYKQRLDEKLDRSGVAGTPLQRVEKTARAAGAPESFIDLALGMMKRTGTKETTSHEHGIHKAEVARATRRVEISAAAQRMARELGLPAAAARLLTNKEIAGAGPNRGISRRERGELAAARSGYIRKRQEASKARKVARGLAEHFKQRLEQRMLEEGLLGRIGKKLKRAGEAVVAMIRNPRQTEEYSAELDRWPPYGVRPLTPANRMKALRAERQEPWWALPRTYAAGKPGIRAAAWRRPEGY